LAAIPFYPLHFDEDVPSFYTTEFLVDIIRQNCRILAPSIRLFFNQTALPKDELLPIGASLEQLGFKGGLRLSPEEVTIYYQLDCRTKYPLTNLCRSSIDNCYVLWDEAGLWQEDVTTTEKTDAPPRLKSAAGSAVPTTVATTTDESDSSSEESLAEFFSVEKVGVPCSADLFKAETSAK
uniref:RNA_pol_Rpb5_N domain-containing protein n=1 Tax=Mesocestoides corti TaxID=53468 RepID=A0A0R3UP16_MESCO